MNPKLKEEIKKEIERLEKLHLKKYNEPLHRCCTPTCKIDTKVRELERQLFKLKEIK